LDHAGIRWQMCPVSESQRKYGWTNAYHKVEVYTYASVGRRMYKKHLHQVHLIWDCDEPCDTFSWSSEQPAAWRGTYWTETRRINNSDGGSNWERPTTAIDLESRRCVVWGMQAGKQSQCAVDDPSPSCCCVSDWLKSTSMQFPSSATVGRVFHWAAHSLDTLDRSVNYHMSF